MDKGLPSSRCALPRRIHRRGGQVAQAGQVGPLHEQKIFSFDFETDPFKAGRIPKAFAGAVHDHQGTSTKWGTEKEVIAWVIREIEKRRGKIAFAHNGGKFDLPGYLFQQGGKKLWGEPVKLVGNRIVSLKWLDTEIRDSYAILPAPLREYDKGEINYQKLEANVREKYKHEILTYLRRDVSSLFDLVLRFVEQHGLKPLTAATAAMRAIKASGVKIDNLDVRGDEKFRKWYFGGRVQVFKPGVTRGRFRVYDIKSAYPYAMLSNHAVTDEFKHLSRPKKIAPTDFIAVRGSCHGAFPSRTKTGLRFPHGPNTYFVTGWEYEAAKLRNLLGRHTILYVERPTRTDNFGKYVREFYEQKREAEAKGDRAGKLIAKILINSGYGKLAQRPEKWRDYMIVSNKDVISKQALAEGWREDMCDEHCKFAVWSRPAISPPYYYNVAAAASITGCVRARLIALQSHPGLCYCDTDSVILKDAVLPKTGKELGDWDLEVEGDLLMIAGKKLYGLRVLPKYCSSKAEAKDKHYEWYQGRGWKMATKGCRLTPLQLAKVCKGETVEYKNKAPTFSLASPSRWIKRNIRKTV